MKSEKEVEKYEVSIKAKVRESVDVLVVGGGSAGVTAALAAARTGVKVLLLESSGSLGGMITSGNAGLTNFIIHQNNQRLQREVIRKLHESPESVQIAGGLPMEITRRLLEKNNAVGTAGTAASYVFTSQAEFKWLLLDMMEEEHVKVLFHSAAVDLVKNEDGIEGIVIHNKEGFQVISAKIIIDASGDADIAAMAGCPFILGVGEHDKAAESDPSAIGKMGAMGVMYRVANVDLQKCMKYLGENPDHFQIQMLALYSMDDIKRYLEKNEMACFMVRGKDFSLQVYNSPIEGVVTLCCPCWEGNGLLADDLSIAEFKMKDIIRKQLEDIRLIPGFDQCRIIDCPEIGVRETRHVMGEYILNIGDVLEGKDFPDSIGRGAHTIDAPHVPEDLKKKALPENWCFHIPYRCLIPQNSSNLLVVGRSASYTHEAYGCARTTVQCMITGEAAGVAAGLCARDNTLPKNLDFQDLRKELVRRNVLL